MLFLCSLIPGKILLACLAIDYSQKLFDDDGVAVAYIYCNYQSQLRQTPVYLAASLLRQFLEHKPSLFNSLTDWYEDHLNTETCSAIGDVFTLLQLAISSFMKVFIVVDALDELLDQYRQDFLARLYTLQNASRSD